MGPRARSLSLLSFLLFPVLVPNSLSVSSHAWWSGSSGSIGRRSPSGGLAPNLEQRGTTSSVARGRASSVARGLCELGHETAGRVGHRIRRDDLGHETGQRAARRPLARGDATTLHGARARRSDLGLELRAEQHSDPDRVVWRRAAHRAWVRAWSRGAAQQAQAWGRTARSSAGRITVGGEMVIWKAANNRQGQNWVSVRRVDAVNVKLTVWL